MVLGLFHILGLVNWNTLKKNPLIGTITADNLLAHLCANNHLLNFESRFGKSICPRKPRASGVDVFVQ